MKFIVKTKSCFENVYCVEAQSKDEAILSVMDSYSEVSFYQKHLGENVICVEQSSLSDDHQIQRIRSKGYY